MPTPLTVAVLSPTPTWPQDYGNRKRVHGICEGLSQRGARIEFFLYALEDDWRAQYPRAALEHMRRQWDDVHIIVPSVPYHPPPKGEDHLIDEWWDPAIETYLQWYFQSRRPDALLVNYAYLSRALEIAPRGCLRILDTHDRLSDRRAVLRSLGLEPEFFHTTAEEEAKALDRADLVLAIKDEEAAYFGSISRTPALSVPFVEAASRVVPTADPNEYLRVGLLGARNNVNVSSVSRFLEVALPLIREQMAPIEVVLAGSMCTDLGHFAGHPGVTSLGYIDDVKAFYEGVDVVVIPVERSTGQKIRVGEALGYGLPIVAHEHAFEGYVPRHAYHRLADLESLAAACVDLAFDRSLLDDLASASRSSQIVAAERADSAIGALTEVVRTNQPTSCFLVPVQRLELEPELRAHLASMVSFAATYSRVRVLLTGFPVGPRPMSQLAPLIVFLRRFGIVLACEPGIEPDLLVLDGIVADLRATMSSPEIVGVWCYDDDQMQLLAQVDCNVLLSFGFSPDMAGSERPQGLVPCVEGMISMGRVRDEADGPVFHRRHDFPVATLGAWVPSELMGQRPVESTSLALVLCDPRSAALTDVVLTVLRRAGISAILTGQEGCSPPGLVGSTFAGESGWTPTILGEADAKAWLRRHAPAFSFDCSLGSSSMVPLIAMTRRHWRSGRSAMPWSASSLGYGGTLTQAARSVLDAIGPPGEDRADAADAADAAVDEEDGLACLFDGLSREVLSMPIDMAGLGVDGQPASPGSSERARRAAESAGAFGD